ncbi:MAG: 23S rRNA (adenine(2503)-C(2))-methyltransferase RlmN [Candidatus Peribacteraceae bacterium]|nr:23S rRNA (adenine(2503)-C(2))-methyltransferase RlmN [Candidatus Peribacteraceae bacterium]
MRSSSRAHPRTRREHFIALFPSAPAFRLKQVAQALFQEGAEGWQDITTFPASMREALMRDVPWMSVSEAALRESKRGDTFKAVLKTADGLVFETVLMANARDQWTVCVSSQIGCAMRCTFCATGAMGLRRSLTEDEIVDQLRFWRVFLRSRPHLPERISNVVFMGMGEPLANYENVKSAIRTWLACTDLGPTHVTVSTVGVLPQMEALLTDRDWPAVRIAISLHSADQKRREEIVPSTVPDFLVKLADWSRRYVQILGNRRHHLTFEYTLLQGVNDTEEVARGLGTFIRKTGVKKLNVIPWNPVSGKAFAQSTQERIDRFKAVVSSFGIDVTQRHSMGEDIAAACGQLATAHSGDPSPREE